MTSTSAYDLRRHLAADHDVRISSADYATLVTLHTAEHHPALVRDHEHDDGPNTGEWRRDCSDFGCGELAH